MVFGQLDRMLIGTEKYLNYRSVLQNLKLRRNHNFVYWNNFVYLKEKESLIIILVIQWYFQITQDVYHPDEIY